jgi:pimeloyl-ACP methyl ester carboxylesterase
VLADATPDTIFDAGSIAARAAIVAKIEEGLPTAPASLAPEIWRTVKEEHEAIDRAPEALRVRDGYGRLGDLPLVVVRRGRESTPPSDTDLSWRRDQEHLATLSTNSLLIVAEKNGHVIPLENPAIIADAVRRVIEAWRHKASVK